MTSPGEGEVLKKQEDTLVAWTVPRVAVSRLQYGRKNPHEGGHRRVASHLCPYTAYSFTVSFGAQVSDHLSAKKGTTMNKSKNADDGGRRAGIVGRKTPLSEELWDQLPSSVQAALWVVVEEYEWRIATLQRVLQKIVIDLQEAG